MEMEGSVQHDILRIRVHPVDVAELVGMVHTGEGILIVAFHMQFEGFENDSESEAADDAVVHPLVVFVETALFVGGEPVSPVSAEVDQKPEDRKVNLELGEQRNLNDFTDFAIAFRPGTVTFVAVPGTDLQAEVE
jgi:hypothetical protein